MLLAIWLLVAVGAIAFLMVRSPKQDRATGEPAAPPEVSRTNLALVDGHLRLTGATTPFNGFMLEHYADGTQRSRSAISNGLLNGLSQGWYTNGQMQVSENFSNGVSHGLRTKWYPDGVKQSEAGIVDGKLQGTFRKWHTNGVLSDETEMIANQPNGTSTAWFSSGYLKARVTLRDGKPVEQTFWKDGERKE